MESILDFPFHRRPTKRALARTGRRNSLPLGFTPQRCTSILLASCRTSGASGSSLQMDRDRVRCTTSFRSCSSRHCCRNHIENSWAARVPEMATPGSTVIDRRYPGYHDRASTLTRWVKKSLLYEEGSG